MPGPLGEGCLDSARSCVCRVVPMPTCDVTPCLPAVESHRSIHAAPRLVYGLENQFMTRLLLLFSWLAFSTLALAATINLNSATQAQLAGLPQMDPVKAKAIVDYRAVNGCFKAVSDLLKVRGVTQADVDAISSLVDVGTCPKSSPPAPAKAQT